MFEKNTGELKNELKREQNISDFLENNKAELTTFSVPQLLTSFAEKYDAKQKDVIKKSFIPDGYAYQLFEGRKNGSRDKLLRLALAYPLSIADANRLLRAGGFNDLYVRSRRDAIIMYCLEKKYSVLDTNNLLYESGEEIL